MATVFGSIRRLAFAPSLSEVTFAARGFPVPSGVDYSELEAIPHAVIVGFEASVDARSQWEIERRLSLVNEELRGFAYEGATMGLTIMDAFTGRRRGLTRALLVGPAQPHTFLTYIGIGFAMARLPRRLWGNVVPELTGEPYFPAMSWLAVDGYGFDRAYFQTERWVDAQHRPAPYAWLGAPDYFQRAVDQGIGRALWFIRGARAEGVATAVRAFASERRADLWSGVGLAAAFAGGTDADGLRQLLREAGEFAPEVAQGVVFAAKARTYAGLVPAKTELAAQVVCGLSAERAADLADDAATGGDATKLDLDYDLWRQRVRQHFVSLDALRGR